MPREDAKAAFDRERRRRALARIAVDGCASSPTTSRYMLPFEEVVAALGRDLASTTSAIQVIPLDSIVGTVDRRRGEFDRDFRPSAGARARWERIAEARKRGEAMPPIDVYRIGDLHFVRDGHHRVSVARALGDTDIDAHVTEVRTKLGADRELRLRDLPLKAHERVFRERVPLPPEQRARIQLSDEWRYAQLATLVESWGYRASPASAASCSPAARWRALWFNEEYEPVVDSRCASAGSAAAARETERYLRIAMLRYLLLQTHDWTDEVVERLLGEVRNPSAASTR